MKTNHKPKSSSVALLDRKMELERYVLNHLAEVHNIYGGVTGYRLDLGPAETEKLIELIEAIK